MITCIYSIMQHKQITVLQLHDLGEQVCILHRNFNQAKLTNGKV